MFNKLKHLKDLRSQAKTLQNSLAGESVTVKKNGVKITMDGNMEITSIDISEDLSKEKLEETLKDLINQAIKKTQRIMAQKMQAMGGFPGLT
ncbi:DNA-binding protein [Candidatus Falkowbacteria bacterium CG11_big_fil_rev_8_21_14_0_20_39_10]|uniref:DNA-binding protein n=1 Tax=Candidatus Falkowbacteria bacterium CG11_big_fil_rev_8_21_14_0_20_39_10 TaxID=1974570 RepID=A0A2M6K872_9BACT|nr:MAG: DNA-binding protein [Candidatus Falkowbacteria bacterium CG11_big_fil_rev_8_21_14_0_20_39_10]